MSFQVPSVLVADDNEATRTVIEVALRGAGYAPVLAASGREAIEKLARTPSLAAVLADVVMPEIGGVELARQVRELRPGLPVILMTGYDEFVEAVNSIGAIPLIKPFTASMLIRVLQDSRDAARGGVDA